MCFFKNKLIYFTFLLLVFYLVIPCCVDALEESSYVWSEISSPIITTSSILSEDER